MANGNARDKLIDFLDKKAFDPVLKATLDDYKNERDREKLIYVQETTRSTKQRYHQNYTSAKEVVDNFQSDLSSESAQKVHGDLRSLGLPTLPELKDDFKRLAEELGVM